jgi:hypothetical protein
MFEKMIRSTHTMLVFNRCEEGWRFIFAFGMGADGIGGVFMRFRIGGYYGGGVRKGCGGGGGSFWFFAF